MTIRYQMMFVPLTIAPTDTLFAEINDLFGIGIDNVWAVSGTYYSPEELRSMIEGEIQATFGPNYIVEWSNITGRLKIRTDNEDNFTIQVYPTGQWSGFNTALHSGNNQYTAEELVTGTWFPSPAVAVDSGEQSEEPNTVVHLAISGRGKTIEEGRHFVRELRFDFLPPSETFIARESVAGTAFENVWRNGRARLRYWLDRTAAYTGDYFFDGDSLAEYKPERMSYQKELYSVSMKLRRFV